jgi:hypothetical protein
MNRLNEILPIDRVFLGIQSMLPEAHQAVGRGWFVPQLEELSKIPEALRKKIVIELMLPLPKESPESFLAGLEHLFRLGYYRYQIFPLMVLRGSALRRQVGDLGLRHFPTPPYLCYETPTFPTLKWTEMCALGQVLTVIGMDFTEDERNVIFTAFDDPRRLFEQILEQFRSGMPVTEIVAGWRRHPGIPENRVAPVSQEKGPQPISPACRTAVQKVLDHYGLHLVYGCFLGKTLEIEVTGEEQHFTLRLFPDTEDEPFFLAGGGWKISYRGTLPDKALLDEILQWGSTDTFRMVAAGQKNSQRKARKTPRRSAEGADDTAL